MAVGKVGKGMVEEEVTRKVMGTRKDTGMVGEVTEDGSREAMEVMDMEVMGTGTVINRLLILA